MKSSILISGIVAFILVAGVATYALISSGGLLSQASTQSGLVSTQPSPSSKDFVCAKPAIVYQYTCDQVPQGYVIPARLPNAPAPFCPTQMTPSACILFKQTFGTGICTPNETVYTDPLDCGCTGALLADPYTGRCTTPAAVCQVVVQEQQNKAGG